MTLGAGRRARDPRPAEDADEDVLPLRDRLRRRRRTRRPARSASASRARCRCRTGARSSGRSSSGSRSAARSPTRAVFAPQELLLSRPAEGLPDLPVRLAALHRTARASADGRRRRRGRDRARPPRGGRGQERRTSAAARGRIGGADHYARRLQPRRHAAGRDRHRARHPLRRRGASASCSCSARRSSSSGSRTRRWRRARCASTPTSRSARPARTSCARAAS